MKIATVAEIKRELKEKSQADLTDLVLRLARGKKENKELLNYLIFEAHDEEGYVSAAKEDVSEIFEDVNTSSFFLAKKTIRKALRFTNKHIKFSSIKETEVELLIHFAEEFNALELNLANSKVMYNLYVNVIKKLDKAISQLHEDLQYDYEEIVEDLKEGV